MSGACAGVIHKVLKLQSFHRELAKALFCCISPLRG